MRHDRDIGVSVARVLDDTPAKARKEVLCARREKIDCVKTERCCFAHDVLRERTTDAALPMLWSNEDASEPRGEMWARIHLVVDKHGGAE